MNSPTDTRLSHHPTHHPPTCTARLNAPHATQHPLHSTRYTARAPPHAIISLHTALFPRARDNCFARSLRSLPPWASSPPYTRSARSWQDEDFSLRFGNGGFRRDDCDGNDWQYGKSHKFYVNGSTTKTTWDGVPETPGIIVAMKRDGRLDEDFMYQLSTKFYNRGMRAWVGEIIAFDRELDDDEIRDLHGYLAAKWNISLDGGLEAADWATLEMAAQDAHIARLRKYVDNGATDGLGGAFNYSVGGGESVGGGDSEQCYEIQVEVGGKWRSWKKLEASPEKKALNYLEQIQAAVGRLESNQLKRDDVEKFEEQLSPAKDSVRYVPVPPEFLEFRSSLVPLTRHALGKSLEYCRHAKLPCASMPN